ncbi:pyridoxamine 5'-phosphate oxidase family protein [Actinacidiphila soli]|uniref:pyridoxamine 5'-phosphate oxidase family protein n=1 Tax=Actinacidiphila soli TaxID=2487275 RepID=UPI000FC9BE7A|nr:pyridoxamine 5'-phosphate oxidase family protein [Actinacidiphila soli]
MTEQTKATGDIGRRIALRREQLGLTREQVSDRAGTAPGYLQYVEEQPAAAPDLGFMLRLAEALETSLSRLHGGDADLPPGTGRAARHPELVELAPDECWAHLATHGVGRIAVSTPDGPAIAPVNYTVADRAVAFRTAAGATPALAAGTETAFEVDHIDEALSQGWSVLVVGHADHVTDPGAVRRLADAARTGPWAGGDRELWVRIEPVRVTGRRILVR